MVAFGVSEKSLLVKQVLEVALMQARSCSVLHGSSLHSALQHGHSEQKHFTR